MEKLTENMIYWAESKLGSTEYYKHFYTEDEEEFPTTAKSKKSSFALTLIKSMEFKDNVFDKSLYHKGFRALCINGYIEFISSPKACLTMGPAVAFARACKRLWN